MKLRKVRILSLWLLVFLSCCLMTFIWHRLSNESNFNEIFSDKIALKTQKELKSWNNIAQMNADSLRSGFGEHGRGESLTDPLEIAENEKLFKEFGLNVIVSDKISLNRSIPDFRHPKCLEKFYHAHLPRVSIIIIFNDETASVFKRSLHSLYNRTPLELIEEIILVDDYSQQGFYGTAMSNYILENFPGITFHVLRLTSRNGIAKTRNIGAASAKGEFLFFMEPHCEITYNWLPPLLQPVVDDHETVTVPIVDNIEYMQMHYYENDKGNLGSRGVFDWNLEYQKLKRLQVDEENETEPFSTPIMTGGIFLMRKTYFFRLGAYDEKLKIYGAENIEMSLKIHLCGGRLLEVPCSHIGHGYRAFTKSRKDSSGIDFITYNRKRVVEVWFDEYKKFVYDKNRDKYEKIGDVGSLTAAKITRDKLKCKSFDHFVKVVAPDLLGKFPLESPPFAKGLLVLENSNVCMTLGLFNDYRENVDVKLADCHEGGYFELSWYRDLRFWDGTFCIDAYDVTQAGPCHLEGGNQLFKYNLESHQLASLNRDLCIEANLSQKTLKLEECDDQKFYQRWIFTEFTNETALRNWKESGRPFEDKNSMTWE